MTCPLCTLQPLGGGDLCRHHGQDVAKDWHVGNRVMNDFLMRGLVGESAPMTDDEFVAFVEARS